MKRNKGTITVPFISAEGEGFKPPIPERGIPDFESSAIDHSANLPNINNKKQTSLGLRMQRYKINEKRGLRNEEL